MFLLEAFSLKLGHHLCFYIEWRSKNESVIYNIETVMILQNTPGPDHDLTEHWTSYLD